MATLESMAIRSDEAMAEIEAILGEMRGEAVEPLPRIDRDREMLRVIQLEGIAAWLREIQVLKPKTVKTVMKRKPRTKKVQSLGKQA
jgi:hypothetical protein